MIIDYIRNGQKVYPIGIPYSTTEQRIGTWIDGNPLYCRVVSGTTRNDGDYTDLITNVNKWWVAGGFIYESSSISRPYNYYSTNGQGNLDFDIVNGGGNLRYRVRGSQIYNKAFQLIIIYTKITD